ncbi:MAG: radical SAM protein [archaeon]
MNIEENINNLQMFKNYVKNNIRFEECLLLLKLTNKCNQNCSYCYSKHNHLDNLDEYLDINKAKEAILKIAPAYKKVTINITGGDPFTLPKNYLKELIEFIDLYEQVKPEQINDKIIHGDIQNIKDDEIIELLKKHNYKIGASYDGYAHDVNRNGNSKSLMSSVKKLNDEGFYFGYSGIITQETMKNVNKEIELSLDSKTHIFYNPVTKYACPEDLRLDPGDLFYFIVKKYHIAKKFGKPLPEDVYQYIMPLLGKLNCMSNLCMLGNNNITIFSNGDINGCPYRNETETIYGNINDIKNAYDIFNLEGYNNFIEVYYKKLKGCKNCEIFDYCHTGCLNNDSIFQKDVYCLDRKLLFNYFKEYFEINRDELEKIAKDRKIDIHTLNNNLNNNPVKNHKNLKPITGNNRSKNNLLKETSLNELRKNINPINKNINENELTFSEKLKDPQQRITKSNKKNIQNDPYLTIDYNECNDKNCLDDNKNNIDNKAIENRQNNDEENICMLNCNECEHKSCL